MSDQHRQDDELLDAYLREHFGVEPPADDTLTGLRDNAGEMTEEEALASYRHQHFPRTGLVE